LVGEFSSLPPRDLRAKGEGHAGDSVLVGDEGGEMGIEVMGDEGGEMSVEVMGDVGGENMGVEVVGDAGGEVGVEAVPGEVGVAGRVVAPVGVVESACQR